MAFMRNTRRGGAIRSRRNEGSNREGRGARGGRGGPKLPSTLMAEVDATYGQQKQGYDDRPRKARRKAAREEKRVQPSSPDRPPSSAEEQESGRQLKPVEISSQRVSTALPDVSAERKKRKRLPDLALPTNEGSNVEDEEIQWLEWMLKGKIKGKERAKAAEGDAEVDDGLDELIDLAEVIGPGGSGLPRREGQVVGEDEAEDEDFHEDRSRSEDDEQAEIGEDGELEHDDGLQNLRNLQHSEDSLTRIASTGYSNEKENDTASSEGRYLPHGGAPIASSSSANVVGITTRYMPPQIRAAQLGQKSRASKEKAEERIRLERRAQGLLNKLSEANIESLIGEIEKLYSERSRNDVTTTLTSLILMTISSRSNLLDSFVVLYATLVGALHRIMGIEFGAHFVHTLVMRYHFITTGEEQSTLLAETIYETPDASKEGLNLVVLISELYNAGVVSAKLIYDLIRSFLEIDHGEEGMQEREVERLLKILRCCGAQMRSDDSSSLKDIVSLVEGKTRGREKTMTSRARFMVETLSNVKNNKIRSASGTEQGNDAVERMKKFLSSLGRRRRLLSNEPLRVGFSDLLDADKKGKWWLVGAGWTGNPLLDRKEVPLERRKREPEVEDEVKLLEVAKRQGMNTEVRRSTFFVLMTSEDYMHACERLTHLRFTAVQQREFVRVILHCAGLEKTYNPYYTLILDHICSESYDHRFTLQYSLWDFLRILKESETQKALTRKSGNIARTMGFVIAHGTLDISVFKAVEWTSISNQTADFLLTFLVHLILATQTPSPLFVLPKTEINIDEEIVEEVFEKALINSELSQGWLVFLKSKRTSRVIDGLDLGEREREVVAAGLGIAQRILGHLSELME